MRINSVSKKKNAILLSIFVLFDLINLTSSIQQYSGTNNSQNNNDTNDFLALTNTHLWSDNSPSIQHDSINHIMNHATPLTNYDRTTTTTIPCLLDSADSENSAKFLSIPGINPPSAIETLMNEQAKMKTKSIGKNILIPTIRNNNNNIISSSTSGRMLGLSHIKATILTIVMISSILAKSWSLFAISAILYLLEASTCSTRRYLSNRGESPSTILDYIHQLRCTEPKVKWTIQCYHYRTHSTTDRNGKRTTHRTKVVTYRASEDYHFQNWKDLTHIIMPFLEDILRVKSLQKTVRFIKLSCWKLIFMDKTTMMDYFIKQKLFFNLNGNRDWHTELFTSLQGTESLLFYYYILILIDVVFLDVMHELYCPN